MSIEHVFGWPASSLLERCDKCHIDNGCDLYYDSVTDRRGAGRRKESMERVTVTVPWTFYEDHAKRGCVEYSPEPIVSRNGARVTVSLDRRDLQDLYSDAHHYATSGIATYGRDMIGVISSARATVKALVKQGYGQ